MASDTITRNDLTAILNSVLPNPADMTPQEVEDFIDSLLGQGSNIADFVVEQGTETVSSTVWTYRKWNSGISECWAKASFSVSYSAWGSIYSSGYGQWTYPTGIFTSAPTCCITPVAGNGDAWIYGSGSDSATKTVKVAYARATSASAGTGYVYIYSIGRWK